MVKVREDLVGKTNGEKIMSKELLITLTGRSGCGKSAIAERLNRKFGYIQAKSYTTRPIRTECEGDELTHTFIEPQQVIEYKNDIVAYNEYNGYEYFVTNKMLENCQFYVVDKQGLIQLYKNYHDKDILSIYIDCDSSIASRRMAQRGDSDEQIMQRLQYDEKAFEGCKEFCDFVIPNEIQNGINDIVDWIDSLYRYYRIRG